MMTLGIPPLERWLLRSDPPGRRAFAVAALFLLCLTLARLVALFLTPVELYPDEAQYWVWSRDLAWGYYSKPPMVAWLIHLTTGIGGQSEAWIRVSSVLLHGAAPLFLFGAANRLYGPREGLLAVMIYALMPGVQLSSGVASTDAPLLFLLSGALWAYARLMHPDPAEPREWTPRLGRWRAARDGGLVGLFLGLALLSKYAAVYAIAGMVLHSLIREEARRRWRPASVGAATAAVLVLISPNLGWNAHNQFSTFAHTAKNADWNSARFFHPGELWSFVADQVGVFGPVPIVALLLGAALILRRRRAEAGADSLLMCLTAPALVAVAIQALIAKANANWAFSAYVSGSILAAAWMIRWKTRSGAVIGLALQAVLAGLFLVAAVDPALADRMNLGNSLKRARGWEATTAAILDRAAAQPGLTAIAVDERFLFNEMRYYGRDRLARPGTPPLRMWVREIRPMNHAELTAPLTPDLGGRVLIVSRIPEFRSEFVADFARVLPGPPMVVRLDARRTREAAILVGERFAPRPRDQISGLPRRP